MCGVIGFVTDKPSEDNYQMLGDLLYISAERGTDATGIAIIEDKKIKVIKEDIPADKFIKKYYLGLKKEISKASIVIGHTRLATQGHQQDNNNNHPIIGEKYVMVHNGVCSSMTRIKDYPYKGTVDSEILLSYIEKSGLEKGLEELQGSAAVAIVKKGEPNIAYLWRHNNPLWIAYDPDKKTIFFASTEDILEDGLSNLLNFFSSFRIKQSAEDLLYKITCNPLNIEIVNEVKPKQRYVYSSHNAYNKGQVIYPSAWGGFSYGEVEDYGRLEGVEGSSSLTPLNNDVPKEESEYTDFSAVYKAAIKCKWDSINKIYTTDSLPIPPTNSKYYFSGASLDFEHWSKLEGGGHVSIDRKLVKFFDKERKSHFLMTISAAIKEGLIDMSK